MYRPLLLEQMLVDRERELADRAALARRGGRSPLPRRREWWPRPRRTALRLAFAAIRPRPSH